MTTTSPEQAETSPQEPIVARAAQYYRNTRYLIVVMLLGYGLWSIRDGYYKWPQDNEEWIAKTKREAIAHGQNPDNAIDEKLLPHSGVDIPFNRVIGLLLPPLALVVLLRALYNSRGEYRLQGMTLSVPGHPPVPFVNITEIDRTRWDRKGIADVYYDLGNGKQGRLRLDDFVYDRLPTDEIFKRIEDYVIPAEEGVDKKTQG